MRTLGGRALRQQKQTLHAGQRDSCRHASGFKLAFGSANNEALVESNAEAGGLADRMQFSSFSDYLHIVLLLDENRQ
jgi:hypothetical protein